MRNEMENFFHFHISFFFLRNQISIFDIRVHEYPITSIQFRFFFFFSLPLKNRTEFENAIFTPRSLFIFVRGILRIPIQFREFFYI